MVQNQHEGIDPLSYFENLKNSKRDLSSKFLQEVFDNTELLLKKAYAINQVEMCKKLIFTIDVISKEYILHDMGFKTFVYRDDIEYFMDKVADKAVKILELARYPREIPSEVAEKIIELNNKGIFDEYYVVFTDYTGNIEREVEAERKRKDPILFGAFSKRDGRDRQLHDRFYYIADWEDEYCDLTLNKMIGAMADKGKKIDMPVALPDSSVDSIREYVAALQVKSNSEFRLKPVKGKKKSFFDKISFWK